MVGKVADIVLLLESEAATGASGGSFHPSATPDKDPIVKRRRHGNDMDDVDTDMTIVAASQVEDRQP